MLTGFVTANNYAHRTLSLGKNAWRIWFMVSCNLCRNRCIRKSSNKDLIKVEIKVVIICCCYVILGFGATLAYAISSSLLGDLRRELFDYFECEQCGVNSGQTCDRSGFERLTNPPLVTIGYSLLALYPVITLIYVLRIKRKPRAKHTLSDMASNSTYISSNQLPVAKSEPLARSQEI